MMTIQTVALLAPVPFDYLEDGCDVCQEKGKIAFGSRAFDFFYNLSNKINTLPIDVYIYESQNIQNSISYCTWRGTYIGFVGANNEGHHPDGLKYRPKSSENFQNKGHEVWYVFWEVTNLRKLSDAEKIPMMNLRCNGQKKFFGKYYVPRGPILIENPEFPGGI